MSDSRRDERAKARAGWPVQRVAMADQGKDVLVAVPPAERVAMVWALTCDAWAMSGRPMPDYPRSHAPGRIVRGRRP